MALRFHAIALLITVWMADTGTSPSDCANAVAALFSEKSPELMRMTLSSGKALPKDAGKYRMCMNAKQSRYFLVSMNGTMPLPHPVGDKKSMSLPLELGFCLPSKCDHAGVKAFLESPEIEMYLPELSLYKVQLSNIQPTSPQLDLKSEDALGVVVAVVVGLLACLVLVSTGIVHMKQSYQSRDSPRDSLEAGQQLLPETAEEAPPRFWNRLAKNKVVKAFALNGESGTLVKLVEIPSYKPTDSLNGLRVLSMVHIILGHSFLMSEGISGYSNQEDIVESSLNTDSAENNPLFGLVLSAQSGVDTFFYLSGFLLSHLTLKELRQRNGQMSLRNIIQAILLRYFRLTPSLALAMAVYYKIWSYLGFGPFAVRFQQSITQRCDDSWWSELLYTMNFVPFDSDKVCMGWTWYLGDDMIFFIITMFILPAYYYKRILGWLMVGFITALSFGATTWLIIKHNLSIYVFDDHYTAYSYWAYSKPYTRIPAYFVGVVSAWILSEMEERGITRSIQPFSAIGRKSVFAISVLSAAVLVFLVLIPITDFGDHANSWGTVASVLYIVGSRPLWAMAFAALTLLCYYDCLPILNEFLSHKIWTPLARLTYGAYLCHPLVIKLAAGTSMQYYTFSGMDLFYRVSGNCVMAFSGGVVLWVLVERPAMSLISGSRNSVRRSPSDQKHAPSAEARS